MNIKHSELLKEIIHYNKGDTRRIQHLVKVHSFAATIGNLEQLDEDTLFTLETAAILHDIGVRLSEEKYGHSTGKYQETEGPPEAEKMMVKLGGYSQSQIERVKYLIGHHHTYTNIDGIDYQILIEADFLVNLYENAAKYGTAKNVLNKIFKTETGKQLLIDMFLVE